MSSKAILSAITLFTDVRHRSPSFKISNIINGLLYDYVHVQLKAFGSSRKIWGHIWEYAPN